MTVRTSPRIKLPPIALLAGCVLAAILAWDRYTFTVRWPAQVQQEVLGSAVTFSDTMISKERNFAFGEGFARWRYKVDGLDPAIQQLCERTPGKNCAFSRTRKLADGVDLTVTLSGSVLTVEEWWS